MVPSVFLAVLAASVLIVLSATGALAQPAGAEPRLALVIGNAAYPGQALKNPANDARAVSASLRKLGFTVIERIDAGKKAMEDAILDFGEKLRAGGVGLFYYAGHGLQVRGRNYLVPVDANLPSEASVRFQAVDIDVVLEQLTEARNRANIVILDACRNNPFVGQMRGAPSGLAAIDAARGTLIAYSTAPGKVAVDGTGANSPYTAGLVRALDMPGLKAEEMFKRVRGFVAEATKGQQTPWESSSLTGDLVINLNVTVAAPAPAAPANRDAIEAAFWSSIAGSTDAADYEEYLRQFPSGVFSGLAKRRIADINRRQQQAALPPPKAEPPAPPPLPERPRLVIEPVDKEYVATQIARVREAPDTAARQVAALSAGQSVLVTGKVKDQNWFQIEREGKPLGFVAASLLEDAGAWRARQEEENRKQAAAQEEERKRRAAAAAEERRRQAAAEEERRKQAELEKQKQVAAAPPPKDLQAEFVQEQREWAAIANANDPDRFAAFLKRYPKSSYATLAEARLAYLGWSQARISALTGGTTTAAAPATPAIRPGPTREEIAKQIYDRLMNSILNSKFDTFSGANSGKPVNYRNEAPQKVVASCLDWRASSISGVTARGNTLNWQWNMMGALVRSTLETCRTRHESKGCTCQIIDENDKNVLKVPDEFMQRQQGKPAG